MTLRPVSFMRSSALAQPARVVVGAERRRRPPAPARLPSILIGLPSTRKSGRSAVGTLRTMPVCVRKLGVERLVQLVAPARPAAGRRTSRASRASDACAIRRRASRSARRGSAGAAPAWRSAASLARSGRPSASTRLLQNLSVMHMMKIQPSAVGKVCTGATERCALRGCGAPAVALVQVPDGRIAELMQRDVEQAGVDVAAGAARLRAQDAGEQADRAGRARS